MFTTHKHSYSTCSSSNHGNVANMPIWDRLSVSTNDNNSIPKNVAVRKWILQSLHQRTEHSGLHIYHSKLSSACVSVGTHSHMP